MFNPLLNFCKCDRQNVVRSNYFNDYALKESLVIANYHELLILELNLVKKTRNYGATS
jgi:hypothetical protein